MTSPGPDATALPPCGLYRTTVALGAVPAGRLVSFHNHGERGPAVFLPTGWIAHRARFDAAGVAPSGTSWVRTLDTLAPEGIYRVREPFACCAERCRVFWADLLVQLAYTDDARPVLLPLAARDGALVLPERGTLVDRASVAKLAPLEVEGWT